MDATFSLLFNVLWLIFWAAVVRRCEHKRVATWPKMAIFGHVGER